MDDHIAKGIHRARIIGVETAIDLVNHALKYEKDPIKVLGDYLEELKDMKRVNENQSHGSDLWPEVKK